MRLQRLTEIGFDFQPIKDQVSWEERIQSLKSFVEEHGHCRPSPKHPELGIFVGKVRQQYRERGEGKSNTLTDERVVCHVPKIYSYCCAVTLLKK